MISPTAPAFQPKSGLRFVTLLTLVTLAHVLAIALLLAHFGWLNGVGLETHDNAGQSGFVIPVTLEASDGEENNPEENIDTTLVPTPEPAPDAAPVKETVQEPVQEPTQELTQEKAPTVTAPPPSAAPPTETQDQTTTDVEKEIPLAAEPEAKTAVTPPATTLTPQPAPPPPTEPAPVSPPTTPPQTTTPVLPTPATNQRLGGGSSGTPSPVALTNTIDDSLPITPAQVDPNYLHRPNPVYPAISKRLREAGTVLLRVSLDATGEVRDINVETTSAHQRLDQAAMEAVRQWRFVPASRGQQSVASTVLVPIEFKHQ